MNQLKIAPKERMQIARVQIVTAITEILNENPLERLSKAEIERRLGNPEIHDLTSYIQELVKSGQLLAEKSPNGREWEYRVGD